VRRGLPTILAVALAIGALGLWAWSFGANKDAGTQVETNQNPGPAATQPAGDGTVRVMTANVRISEPDDGVNAWPNRRDFLVKTLLKQGPDLIGCQEVTPAQQAFMVKELAKWYSYYPRPGVGKVAGDDGSTTAKIFGAVNQSLASLNTLFYKTDRFDILDGEAGLVEPNDLQRDPAENTFYTLAVLKDKVAPAGADGTWIVVDTHLRHHDDFAVKCALAIRGKIGDMLRKHPLAKVVLMGDMNHDKQSKVYAALVGVAGAADGVGELADSFDYSKKRPNEAWGNWHAFTGKSQRMWPTDLIFSSGVRSRGAEFVRDKDEKGHYPSDHFFVVTELVGK